MPVGETKITMVPTSSKSFLIGSFYRPNLMIGWGKLESLDILLIGKKVSIFRLASSKEL
jgi:hypothetical protein